MITLDGTNGITTPDLESAGPVTGTTATFSGNVTLGSSVLATPSGSAPSYTCRAWVNFNGTGTVAIRASGNVSSITDNGVGDYTVNFTTAMPDASYAWVGSGTHSTAVTNSVVWGYSSATQLSGSVRIAAIQAGSGFVDLAVGNVSIFH
jgi:hypothetical protein